MDGHRFDTLARTVATRRSVVKALAGGVAGALLAVAGRSSAVADDCKAAGKRCKKDSQCCSGICEPESDSRSTAHSESVCAPVCAHGQVSDGAGGCTCAEACFITDLECFGGIATTEGCFVCVAELPSCDVGQPSCASSADCAANEICAPGGGQEAVCGVPGANGVCVPLCAA